VDGDRPPGTSSFFSSYPRCSLPFFTISYWLYPFRVLDIFFFCQSMVSDNFLFLKISDWIPAFFFFFFLLPLICPDTVPHCAFFAFVPRLPKILFFANFSGVFRDCSLSVFLHRMLTPPFTRDPLFARALFFSYSVTFGSIYSGLLFWTSFPRTARPPPSSTFSWCQVPAPWPWASRPLLVLSLPENSVKSAPLPLLPP